MKRFLIVTLVILLIFLVACVVRGLVRQKLSYAERDIFVSIKAWSELSSMAVASIVDTLTPEGYWLTEQSKMQVRFGHFRNLGTLEFIGKIELKNVHRIMVSFAPVDDQMRINVVGTVGDNPAQELLYCFLGLQDVDVRKPMGLVFDVLAKYGIVE